jgi:glycosyltransferase involved in cell wall biosynthesis
MKISIIIPTRNEEKIIGECLQRCVEQTRVPDEIIVADESTDKTPQIVEALAKESRAITLVRVAGNRGVSFARNKGVAASKGDVLVMLDADMMLDRNCIEELGKTFSKRSVMLASFKCKRAEPRTFIEKCYWVRATHYGETRKSDSFVAPQCYRRSAFMRLGGYDERLRYFEDRDIGERIKRAGMRIRLINAYAAHLDPRTLHEFFRQAAWAGGSITRNAMARRGLRSLLNPLGPFHWALFFAALVLAPIIPLFVYALALVSATILFELARCVYKTGMVMPSVGYVLLSMVRALVIAVSLVCNLLKRLSSL